MGLHNARPVAFDASPVAVALAAMVIYFADGALLTAVALAAGVHELGHIAALRVLGYAVGGIRAEAQGFCISYSGAPNIARELAAALAGPAAGLLMAYILSYMSVRLCSSWLSLAAGASLILSLFNLLPILPLDGGRALLLMLSIKMDAPVAEERARRVGRALSALIGAAGMVLAACGGGALLAVLCAGLFFENYVCDSITNRIPEFSKNRI